MNEKIAKKFYAMAAVYFERSEETGDNVYHSIGVTLNNIGQRFDPHHHRSILPIVVFNFLVLITLVIIHNSIYA